MTTKISTANIQASTLATLGANPKITQVIICDSSYNNLDDTAIVLAGGYIKIIGSGFKSGATVTVNKTLATSVTFVSSTELRAQVGAQAAGTYVIYVVNSDGSVAIRINAITYSEAPTWVTGSALSGDSDTPVSIQLSATGATTYSIVSGSLPSGWTLSSSGLISGTVTGLGLDTVYNVIINATDTELQDSPRSFAITISVGDPYFTYNTALISASSPLPFNRDSSTNNAQLTLVADTRPFNSNPNTPGYYSVLFNGTNDEFTVADNANLRFGTNPFTVEAWVYVTTAGLNTIVAKGNGTTVSGWLFRINASMQAEFLNVSTAYTNTTTALALNTWNHVAAIRDSSNNLYISVNGVLSSSLATLTANYTQTDDMVLAVGRGSTTNNFAGYISNLRIVNGTAVYTSNFTPSTSPLTAITNTQLLTFQSNRFIDNSANNFTVVPTSGPQVKSFSPFVPNSAYSTYGSAYFDGTGDAITCPIPAVTLGSSTYTIEAWVYQTASGNTCLVGNTASTSYYIQWSATTIYVGDNTTNISAGYVFPLNTWTHIAVCRVSGGTTTIYINGTAIASGAATLSTGSITSLSIGAKANSAYMMTGYISNFRYVAGTAIYTGAFTPPTDPLTAISGTQILTCLTNQPAANNTFLDKSTNDFAITRFGNTTQGTFSPYGAGYSVYFPNASYMNTQSAAGAYTSIPNTTNFDLGTGDFTMEGWIFPMQLPSADTWPTNWQNHSSLFGRGTAGTADGYNLVLGATKLIFQSSDTAVLSGTHNIVIGNWYHVAVSRTSGTLRLFVNGVSIASVSYTGSPGAGAKFFIGCETGEGAYFYGYMSNVRLVKGTGLYTTTFTPSTTPLQPVAGTQVLTNQSQSFMDNSPNFGVVTATNSPSIQRLSPFSGTTLPTPYYSAYFNGSSDYLTTPSTGNFTASGDFTFSCWIYPTSLSVQKCITTNFPTNDSNSFSFEITTSGNIVIYVNGVSTVRITSSSTVSLNTWSFITVARSGTTTTLYINGVSQGTYVASYTLGNATRPVIIGMYNSAEYFAGYIADYRWVTGSVVTTVPTAPLTAISGTVLLTCQSNTFVDNSNNYTITSGTTTVKPAAISPFTPTYLSKQPYSPSTIGGSMYFDGTGDYLQTPNYQQELAVGTGDYTIEFWVYPQATSRQDWVNLQAASGFNRILIYYKSSITSIAVDIGSGAAATTVLSLSGTPTINRWYHIAVCRASGSTKLFVDGVQAGAAYADTNNISNALQLTLGRDPGGTTYMTGYLSDIRMVKTALYTSNFVPTNQPLQPVKNTTLLVNGTAGGIYDSSGTVLGETVGDVKLNTSTVKFAGTTSMYFDGTGDWLHFPAGPNLEFGGGNFTFEFWFYTSSTARQWFIHAATDYWFGLDYNSVATNKLGLWASGNGTSWNLINSDAGGNGICATILPQNQWNHIAVTRNGNVWKVFLNGAQDLNITVAGSIVDRSSQQKVFGSWAISTHQYPINGYVSDLRITKGYARYTSAFTPPTSPAKLK